MDAMSMDSEVKAALSAAVSGLLYPSETDAPFDVMSWPAKGPGAGRKVQEISLDAFFKELAESEDAARFKQLRKVLQTHLTGIKLLRVGAGETKVDVYLVGRAPSGSLVGLHTTSVET